MDCHLPGNDSIPTESPTCTKKIQVIILFPTANLLGFNLWGHWWHETDRKCTPRISGTVLEPCWNLSLLGCKAGQMILVPTRISLEHRVSPSSLPEIVAKPKSQKFIQPFPRKSSNSWRAPTTPSPAGPVQPARPARPVRPAAPRTRPRAAGRRRTRRRRRCEWRSQGSLRSPGASCSEGPGTPPTRPRGWRIGIIYTFKLRAWGSSYPPGSFRHPRDMAFFLLGSMPIIGRSCRFNIGIFPVIHVIDVATRLEPPSSRVSKDGGIPQSCGDGGLVSMARLMNRHMKHVLMGQYLRAVCKGGSTSSMFGWVLTSTYFLILVMGSLLDDSFSPVLPEYW